MKWLGGLFLVMATACGSSTSSSGGTTATNDTVADVGLADDATAVDDTGSVTPTDVVASDGLADATTDPDAIPAADTQPGSDTLGDATTGDDTIATDVKPACSSTTCDDGDPCTDDGCDAAGACVHGPKPGCGNTPIPCTASTDCTAGTCNTALHICVACQKNADCGGTGVCIAQKCVSATPCASDGQCKAANQVCEKTLGFCADCAVSTDCKLTETCTAGKCVPAPTKCASSKDCPGILVCDKGAGICVGCVLPGDCGSTESCLAGQCVPKTCTTPICQGDNVWNCNADGSGYVAAPTSCDDGQVCTTDLCAPGTGCVHGANNAPCSDGDACTTGDACAASKCVSGAVTNCDDNNVCSLDSCQTTNGCVHLPSNATACDDGSACTANDACQGVQCVGKATVNCDDGNVCTADACDKTGCTHTAGAGPCEDGNPCTVSDSCAASACGAGIGNTCDDGNECTLDTCDPKAGCVHTPKVGCTPVSLPPCSANSDCTGGAVCALNTHTCVACLVDGDCGAAGLCQGNVCKKSVACQSDVQCKATKQVCETTAKACVDCNAGTDCNIATGEKCIAKQCVVVKTCASSTECAKVCDKANAVCVDCLADADCTTAQFCGTDHVCHADVCVGPTCNGMTLWSCNASGSAYGVATSCDDGVMCTVDACSTKICTHVGKFDPTAFEFPGNGLDDNCDGKTDDVSLCDTGLSSATAADYAKALDLCAGASDFAVKAATNSAAIRGKFGSTFAPQAGISVVMLSTGIAAAPGETGYAAPQAGTDFQFAMSTNVPLGKCTGAAPQDATVLRVQVQIPPNATAMSFDFAFFSSEYPEYVGQKFSDSFAAVVSGVAYSGDVLGDAVGKCFNANNITFTTCPEPACSKGGSGLTGTGYEGDKVGGAYGWSTASFPVKAGDTVTIQFSVFDVGDGVYDTAVLLDSLRFTNAALTKPTLVAK